MLLSRDTSVLILVDVQEKLTPHVLEADALLNRCEWLIRLAEELSVPVVVSEQYPRGLGKTVEPLKKLTPNASCIEKVHFSCYRDSSFVSVWSSLKRPQAVIIGIETHVCVLQTALDMLDAGIDVFVVVDAVSSRQALDKKMGLKRMKQAGAQLVTSEMVFFEWVEQAGTAQFKALSQAYLK